MKTVNSTNYVKPERKPLKSWADQRREHRIEVLKTRLATIESEAARIKRTLTKIEEERKLEEKSSDTIKNVT